MKIKNWNEYQHYKDRNPPWIKLHRELLDNREFHNLDPVASKVLVMCWLLAAEDKNKEGNLPSIKDIAFRLRMSDESIESSILALNQWIEVDSSDMLADCQQHATPETETEEETKRESETYRASADREMTHPPKDPFFKESKNTQPQDVEEIMGVACSRYQNTIIRSKIRPCVLNLLGGLDKETIIKAIENTSETFDLERRDHQYRPNFERQFDSIKSVLEQSNRAPVAPVTFSKVKEEDDLMSMFEDES